MMYRIATEDDIDGILTLQGKNLVTNLSDEAKKNGFVTTPFTVGQLETLISLEGLFVIDSDDGIVGYTVAAGWDYFQGRPMFDYMIELFEGITYKKIQIRKDNSYQYGPICVDAALRGTDAFPRLFALMKVEMAKKYTIGTTFINKINKRSYVAHTTKAKIDVINEFEFNGNSYYGLAFLTKE